MATKRIEFDAHMAHVLGFRHGPRKERPDRPERLRPEKPPEEQVRDAWEFDMMLSDKAPIIAKRTVEAYLPGLVPVELRCSQIPRSRKTLELLWPDLATQIQMDKRLGIEREDIPQWAAIDAFADAYDMTPQRQHELCPDLVDKCGHNFLAAARELASTVGLGRVGVMCSHMPIADCGARFARQNLGITENDGWLPGAGFGSGAFVHMAFAIRRRTAGWEPAHDMSNPRYSELVSCDYYPVPE